MQCNLLAAVVPQNVLSYLILTNVCYISVSSIQGIWQGQWQFCKYGRVDSWLVSVSAWHAWWTLEVYAFFALFHSLCICFFNFHFRLLNTITVSPELIQGDQSVNQSINQWILGGFLKSRLPDNLMHSVDVLKQLSNSAFFASLFVDY